MSERRLLVDSDVLLILGGAGLFDPALDTLGMARSRVLCLSALPHMLRKGKAFAHYAPAVREEVGKLCAGLAVLPAPPDVEVVQGLAALPDMDEGEAVLLAWMAQEPHYLLTTHDKRALRTLTATPALGQMRAAIAGRVICLETVLLGLVNRLGAATVAQALTPILPTSQLLRAVFTPGNVARPGECSLGLRDYEQQLAREVGADLLWQPGP